MALEGVDVFWLRSDPAQESDRPWAEHVGLEFGRVLAESGVIVLNDPRGLVRAADKMYIQLLPEAVRPRTLVTRDLAEIEAFLEDLKDIVLKPLRGSGGDRVFLVRSDDGANLHQIFEAVASRGYVMAQEYLPEAAEGDLRMFLINGRPLQVEGAFAVFRRVQSGGDLRHNMSLGGKAEKARMSQSLLDLAEAIRPQLVEDGMFLVGLDIAGDRVLEVNVFSPGGLGSCERLSEVDFTNAIIRAVEKKCDVAAAYRGTFRNARIAML
jgi:glutathione synthase